MIDFAAHASLKSRHWVVVAQDAAPLQGNFLLVRAVLLRFSATSKPLGKRRTKN
jgi:hypothetical protein